MDNASVPELNVEIPGYSLLDLHLFWQWQEQSSWFVGIDNVANKKYLASLKPFGHRPGKPRHGKIGVRYEL